MTDLCSTPDCGYPRGDVFVCRNCQLAVRADLARIPELLDDLDITIAKLTARGARFGARSTTAPLVLDLDASEARWVLRHTLRAWAGDAGPVDAARRLRDRLGELLRRPDGGGLVDEIGSAVDLAVRAIDTPTDLRQYLGQCGDIAGRTGCRGAVYASPGRAVGQCHTCGTEHAVAQRRALMLRTMSNQKITAAEIATLLRGLGIEITVRSIQDAARAGRINAVSFDVHRKRHYRVGDVLRTFLGPEALSA